MPVVPRLQRALSGDRRFVDREEAFHVFQEELKQAGDRPRVLSYYGVGGIGKSRLLRELRDSLGGERDCRTAVLDLQIPSVRQHEDALPVLRAQLGREGVRFDRFDIAYAVLWQRLHPSKRLNASELAFVEESDLLRDILDIAGVGVVGTAISLLRLADRRRSNSRRRRTTDEDEVLRRLDEFDTTQVLDATTYLFAEDLRDASTERPFVVFIDAYEALAAMAPSAARVGATTVWLRDLLAQLDRGVSVVASREPLNWEEFDADWATLVRPCAVSGLPLDARLELLTDGGVDGGRTMITIAEASEGLPFYLNLALDMGGRLDGPDPLGVSSEEILQRFLRHVQGDEIRLLELLSVSREFDHDVFKRLAAAFDLPGDRLRWEALTSYSFVTPAGDSVYRLHQLMASALRRRLSADVTRDIHRELHGIWVGRDESAGQRGNARALREAAYHGIHGGALDPDEVLELADRAFRTGGKSVLEAIASDLRRYLQSQPDEEGDLAVRCLETEVAIVMGDAATASRIATNGTRPDVTSVSGARLSLAYAHALRIGGATVQAGRLYDTVWAGHRGPSRFTAALWVADVHMWQGRFATAFALGRSALSSPDFENPALRGDLVRLLHLGHRFHLDFDEAAVTLREAGSLYEASGSVVGLANIRTNEAELLAWTDPESAIPAAISALGAQEELNALHELGKTQTALAVALTRLGRHEEAAESFDEAQALLAQARYRSGLARLELFRAFLHIRCGDDAAAAASTEAAVREFVEAEVYPTLVIAAEAALHRLGRPSSFVSESAKRAREAVQPLSSMQDLSTRIEGFVGLLLMDAP